MNNSAQNMNNGLYFHLPFCHRKCFYCSFVVAIGHEDKMDVYLDALEMEARAYAGTRVTSVYFGGGTPTLLSAQQLERLCGIVRKSFIVADGAEWTVEANPENFTREKMSVLKDSGVNRFSLGIQSLNDGHLKYLGRNHDADAAVRAFHQMRDEKIANISVDLMFGFPDQTLQELREDVQKVSALGSEHVSLYSLTIEEKTKFAARNVRLPDQEFQAEFYGEVMAGLTRAGFPQYEISNFAKPGFESRHNENYWLCGNYLGLGVGAHSHQDGRRFWNEDNLFQYLRKAKAQETLVAGEEVLSSDQRLREAVIFGLRMNRGIDLQNLQAVYQSIYDSGRTQRLEQFLEQGLLYREDSRLKASDRGRMVLDEMGVYLV